MSMTFEDQGRKDAAYKKFAAANGFGYTDMDASRAFEAGWDAATPSGAFEDQVDEAEDLVRSVQFGSVSMLQSRLGFGFAQAWAVMKELEARGVVGPADGAKARSVLLPPIEEAARRDLETLMGQLKDFSPELQADAVWGWMEAQGFRGIPDMPKGERVGYSEGSRRPDLRSEPSDAQVEAALDVLDDPQYEYAGIAMRAALRAAWREGETR